MAQQHTTVNCLISRDGILERGFLELNLMDGRLVDGFGELIKFGKGTAIKGWGNNDCRASVEWGNFIINPSKLNKSLRKLGFTADDFLLQSI